MLQSSFISDSERSESSSIMGVLDMREAEMYRKYSYIEFFLHKTEISLMPDRSEKKRLYDIVDIKKLFYIHLDIFSKISDILNTMPSPKISTSNSASILAVNSAKSGESKPESLFISAFANIFIIIFIILIGVSNSLFL